MVSKPLAIVCDCTARFASNVVGNPEDRFSYDAAQMTDSREMNEKMRSTTLANWKNGIELLLADRVFYQKYLNESLRHASDLWNWK